MFQKFLIKFCVNERVSNSTRIPKTDTLLRGYYFWDKHPSRQLLSLKFLLLTIPSRCIIYEKLEPTFFVLIINR